MKAILTALILAIPAVSPARPLAPIIAPGVPLPPPPIVHPTVCHPRAYYAPRPFLSFSYVSTPYLSTRYVASSPVYRATRYYEPVETSLEADVQRALRRFGYYRGSIDGDIGPRSRAAIREFQADTGLRVTGRIDGSLLRSLGL